MASESKPSAVYEAPERNVGIGKGGRVRGGVAGGTSEFGRSVNFSVYPEKGLYFGYLHLHRVKATAAGFGCTC